MPRPQERSTLLKSVPRAPGRDRARQGDRSRPDRGLVRGRGPDRAQEQDHPVLGTTGNAALGAARSAHRFHLHLRGDPPRRWQGSRARPARLQHRGDEPAPRRNRRRSGSRQARRTRRRPGEMAPLGRPRGSRQHHARGAPAQMPGSSTPPRTSGSSCAITGSRTGCSHPTPILSTIAARPGTSSSSGPGRSCPSAYATGPMGSDQRKLVLACHAPHCAWVSAVPQGYREATSSGGAVGSARAQTSAHPSDSYVVREVHDRTIRLICFASIARKLTMTLFVSSKRTVRNNRTFCPCAVRPGTLPARNGPR